MATVSHQWAIVLAGGDGRRMASVTRDACGGHVPKQFCRFGGETSLLELAIERANQLVEPDHVVVVVQEAHRKWWEPALRGCLPGNILSQPSNRGTAVALLQGLAHSLEHDVDPYVVLLPSDQVVKDELLWHDTLVHACVAATNHPDQLVVVGVAAQGDPHFGWLLPGVTSDDGTSTVKAFVEKPSTERARELAEHGALCSAFVLAGSVRASLRLFHEYAAELVWYYEDALCHAGSVAPRFLDAYNHIPATDFSRDILERAPGNMRVLRCPDCGWMDLGTPERLERWIAQREHACVPPVGSGALTLAA